MTAKLILIPGLGSDAGVWRRTIAALGPEISCQGGDTLRDKSLPAMARRILSEAPPKFALAGVSMGGMVALEIMSIAPQRVTALALVDTRAGPDSFRQKLFRLFANFVVWRSRDFGRFAERSLATVLHPTAPLDVRAEMARMSLRVGPDVYRRQNRAVISRADLRPVLRGLSAPTAVIVGAEDRLTPLALSREIHNLVQGSTLHVLKDCGHLPPIEKPEALAAILKALVASAPCA